MLARHYYLLKRREEMVKVLEQIKSHGKDFPNAYLTVGDFDHRLGDSDEAIRQYKDGIQADSKRKAVYQKHMIEVLMTQGKRTAAAEINEAILKENPKNNRRSRFKSIPAATRVTCRRPSPSCKAVTAAPNNFVAHYNLGRAHAAKGEFEQARQQFMESVRLRPDYLPARLEIAKLQASRGDYDAA